MIPKVLTPGHSLVGGPLTALPDADYSDVPMNKLSCWQFMQRLHSVFMEEMVQGLFVSFAAASLMVYEIQ
jgi:hypothetical protein